MPTTRRRRRRHCCRRHASLHYPQEKTHQFSVYVYTHVCVYMSCTHKRVYLDRRTGGWRWRWQRRTGYIRPYRRSGSAPKALHASVLYTSYIASAVGYPIPNVYSSAALLTVIAKHQYHLRPPANGVSGTQPEVTVV